MRTFIARQPLFDKQDEVIGYELLFRDGKVDRAEVVDESMATMKVVKDFIVNFGVNDLVGQARVYIKFNGDLILGGIPDLFKKEKLVIEISGEGLEDEAVLEKLKLYKK